MTEKLFNIFDVDGTIFLEDHKEGSYHIGEIGNVDVNCLNDIAGRLNELHEEKEQLTKENNELKQLLKLIAEAETFTKVNSVKEVLRNEIKAIDTVTEYSAEAWKDYCILSKFFKEEYGEHWDNHD